MTDFDAAANQLRSERQRQMREAQESLGRARVEAAEREATDAQAWRDEVRWFIAKARQAARPMTKLKVKHTVKKSWPFKSHRSKVIVHGVAGWIVEIRQWASPDSYDASYSWSTYIMISENGDVYAVGSDGSSLPIREPEGEDFRNSWPKPIEVRYPGRLIEEFASWA